MFFCFCAWLLLTTWLSLSSHNGKNGDNIKNLHYIEVQHKSFILKINVFLNMFICFFLWMPFSQLHAMVWAITMVNMVKKKIIWQHHTHTHKNMNLLSWKFTLFLNMFMCFFSVWLFQIICHILSRHWGIV